MTMTSISPKTSMRNELVVELKGLFDTISIIHEGHA